MENKSNLIKNKSEINKNRRKRRSVKDIRERLKPREIYNLINSKECDYSKSVQHRLSVRDRALMAVHYVDVGRGSEITGGYTFYWDKKFGEVTGKMVDRKTGEIVDVFEGKAFRVPDKNHEGLKCENLNVNSERILITNAPTVKRSRKMIDEKGVKVTLRDDFVIPLKTGLFENDYWDQLVPFGWLFLEYLINEKLLDANPERRIFPIHNRRAYQIVNMITGKWLNWFRAQGEHFYGHYLLTDTVKLSKFVNIQDPKHVKHYVGYDWAEQLKNKSMAMDFEWIDKAIYEISSRINIEDDS